MIITDRTPLPLLRPAFAELEGLYEPWHAAAVAEPRLVVLNEPLAVELGLDVEELRSPRGVAALVGAGLPEETTTLAQAYAGHQFGGYSPRLGDGRALLLGELVDREGRRRDLHLKGSGPTPFARGGDGLAALGPMLREHLVGEAMHALGIPTTRALAVVTTGTPVAREVLLPGAVLARVASSHLRVGTFQYVAARGDVALLRQLADHAIARHYPAAADAAQPYVALFEAVAEAQAALVARWMLVGFVHGVMNTDNTSISGETLDYGPCAFMDAYDPATVFSSIDHGGRYAFGNQPLIVQWNLARLGEAMLALFADELEPAVEAANGVLETVADRYERHWLDGMRAKLGLRSADPGDGELARDLLDVLHAQQIDFTSCFRALSAVATGDVDVARRLFTSPETFDSWTARWRARLDAEAATSRRDRRGDGAHQPGIHPAQPPRGGSPHCGNRRRPRRVRAAAGGDHPPVRIRAPTGSAMPSRLRPAPSGTARSAAPEKGEI